MVSANVKKYYGKKANCDYFFNIYRFFYSFRDLKKVRGLHGAKRKALTVAQQNLFLNFIKSSPKYRHWYPTFAVMVGSGLRVGELTGLR